MTLNTPLDFALAYACAGFRVIPANGKIPLVAHGAHDSSADEATLRQWWTKWPSANIGLTLDGLVAVDVDPRNGGDVDVLRHPLPDTCYARTGGGGLHYLYRAANGTKYPGQLAPGVDLKHGAGSYIIVEPSIHASGKKYGWIDETEPWTTRPADAPEWLALDPGQPATNSEQPAGAILEGGRNAHLASLAGSMRRRGMSVEAILSALLVENSKRCAPPLPDADVRKIAVSVARYAPAPDLKAKVVVLDATTDTLIDVTQDNVATIFAQRHADKFRYSHDRGRWYEWDGTRWREETTRLAFEYTRTLTRSLNTEGKREFAKAAFCEGVEKFAQSDRVFALRGDEWDKDPWLLNTPSGTVDLRTGRMRAHAQADLITKITSVAPKKGDAPVWFNFLKQVTKDDVPLREFLQRMSGYVLTGDTREECLFFCYGAGGNGKGTFVGALFNILADFAANATMDTFLSSRHERHSTDLAMLRGARLVTASETAEGRCWDEQRVKAMTGNDPVTARFMRQDNFTYLPRFKLLLLGNNKPVLRTVDDAWRRRFHIVPFTYTPPEKDLRLKARLVDEYPRILNWMIDGCLMWQSDGLKVPQRVLDETADYFAAQDTFAEWVAACCETKASFVDTSARLFRSWKAFAETGGEPVATSKALADRLQQRGFERLPYVPGMGGRGFRGLRTTS